MIMKKEDKPKKIKVKCRTCKRKEVVASRLKKKNIKVRKVDFDTLLTSMTIVKIETEE